MFTGDGFDAQLSYIFPSNYEVIGRFSKQKPHKDIEDLTPKSKQYSLGVTKYIWEHALKIQAEVTNTHFDYIDNTSAENWYVRFQVEIGI